MDPVDARIRELEAEVDRLGDELDGCSILSVIAILAANETDEDDFYNSSIYRDLLRITQSNPERSHEAIMHIRELDEEIANLDDTGM